MQTLSLRGRSEPQWLAEAQGSQSVSGTPQRRGAFRDFILRRKGEENAGFRHFCACKTKKRAEAYAYVNYGEAEEISGRYVKS